MSKTTWVEDFGSSDTSNTDFCKIELDGSFNLDEDGEELTQFSPGAPVYFLVHTAPADAIASIVATNGLQTDVDEFDKTIVSSGNIVKVGSCTLQRTQKISVNSDDDISLTYYPVGSVSIDSKAALGLKFTLDGRTLTPAASYNARIYISYTVQFTRYCFYPPSLTFDSDNAAIFDVKVEVEEA